MLNTAKCSLSQLQLEKHTHSLSLLNTPTYTLLTQQLLTHISSKESKSKKRSLGRNLILLFARELNQKHKEWEGEKKHNSGFLGVFFHFNCEMLLFQLSWLGEKMTAKLTDKSTLVDHERHFWWWFLSCSLQWTCSMNSNRTDLSMTREINIFCHVWKAHVHCLLFLIFCSTGVGIGYWDKFKSCWWLRFF